MKVFLKLCILFFIYSFSFSCSSSKLNTKSLNMNLGFEPQTLDWNIAGDSYSYTVISKIMIGLTQFTELNSGELSLKPGLAKSWDISKDAKEYIFHLDKRAKWSDGRDLKAQDFIDSLERTFNKDFAAPYAELLAVIDMDKSEAVDDKTLKLVLKYPTSYFLYLTASCFSYPIRIDLINKYGESWTEAKNMVSIGPYLLDHWQHEYKIVLKANPDYFLKDQLKNNLNILKFFMVAEQSSAFTLFKNKQFDWIDGGSIPTSEFKNLERCLKKEFDGASSCEDFYIDSSSLLRNTFLGFNVHKEPFDNPLVRKAFAYAIDRKALVKLRGRGDIPNSNWVPPGLPYFYRKDKAIIYDPKKAKALLAKAGYPDAKGLAKIEFLYPSREDAKALAEIMHSMWHKVLGVDVKLIAQEWKVFMKTLGEDAPHLYRLSWGADYPEPSTFMQLFTKNNQINYGKWYSPKYDDLILKAMSSLDKKQSKIYYQKAEKILLEEEMAVAPLFVNRQVLLKQANIKNIKPNPMDLFFIDKVIKE